MCGDVFFADFFLLLCEDNNADDFFAGRVLVVGVCFATVTFFFLPDRPVLAVDAATPAPVPVAAAPDLDLGLGFRSPLPEVGVRRRVDTTYSPRAFGDPSASFCALPSRS